MYGQFNEVKIIKRIYEKYDFPKTCIEFGAYDGITNSNTFYFWKKKGFKSIRLSDYSFFQQALIFNNAKSIIGLHGAGSSNILFAKKKYKNHWVD